MDALSGALGCHLLACLPHERADHTLCAQLCTNLVHALLPCGSTFVRHNSTQRQRARKNACNTIPSPSLPPPQACTPLVYNELHPFSFGLSHLALAAVLGQERQHAMAGTTCSDVVACEPRPRAPNCHRWHNSCWMFRHGCLAESAIVDTPPRGMVARIARP